MPIPDSKIKFSILIGFRNRNISRVTRCIESFAAQTFKNFELIFVDYGSDPEIASSVKKFLSDYPFVKYIYNDTRGWFWNRAHALNTGLVNSVGTYIIASDIDMIHAPNFVEALDQIVQPATLYHYRCYYLPEKFDYSTVPLNAGEKCSFPVSSEKAQGLLVVEREACERVGGWNENFKIYGGEDNEMSQRLLEDGLQVQWLPLNRFTTYHQWHPSHKKSIEVLPYKWKQKMGKLASSTDPQAQQRVPIGHLYTTAQRHSFGKGDPMTHYELTTYFSEQIFSFLEAYLNSESGSCFMLSCCYHEQLYNFQKREPLNWPLRFINFVLKRFSIQIGLQLRYLPETSSPDLFHARDAVFYLLEYLMTVDAVKDYRLTFNTQKLVLMLLRK